MDDYFASELTVIAPPLSTRIGIQRGAWYVDLHMVLAVLFTHPYPVAVLTAFCLEPPKTLIGSLI